MESSNIILNQRYRISNKIAEGGMSIVYLANDIKNEKNQYAIKFLKTNKISNRIEDIIRFKNEAITVSKLEHPNIVKIIEIGEYQKEHFIVMEYLSGNSLHQLLNNRINLTEKEKIEIIISICNGMIYIHNNNIIHRDLKPGNIIIDKNNNIKIIDFGLAQIKELTEIKEIDEIAGTFSYMSPEQCGVIKRVVDERSDLYSLGIIFYQIITEQLPFQGDSVNSIIHKQIASRPEIPTKFNKNIPKIIEKIILKLLEKEQELRYQSVKGLKNDLEKYLRGENDFELGHYDKVIKLGFRTNLIGRDEELQKLKNLYDNTNQGKGSICLISGESGRGKTRLTDELKNYVYKKEGKLIEGKCFSSENKVPYGVIKDALNIYIKIFSKYSKEKQQEIKQKIKNEIGELGQILLSINPLLSELIGDCPPLVELEKDKENKRFLMVVSNFLLNLSKIENGLVIVLDDLQWVEEGNLEILKEMSMDINKFPIFIVGSYRDNEVKENHGLIKFKGFLNENNNPLNEITLNFFDNIKMNEFVAKLLYEDEEKTREMSLFIGQKSKGNPFFAIEILKQLIEEKVIYNENNQWNLNIEQLNKIQISDTIVDIVLKRIQLLEEKEIIVLSYAAIIGRKFGFDLLFKLCENIFSKEGNEYISSIIQIIDKAINLQLLEYDLLEREKIIFVHERIKEAFYKNLSDEKRKELHLQIAKTIEENNKDNIDTVIFDLAYHYIEGNDKEKILKYAYIAGQKSKENYSNDESIKYFLITKKILEEENKSGYEEWTKCIENIVDIYLLIGKNDEAIELSKSLLQNESDPIKNSIIYKNISKAYYQKSDIKNCEEYAKIGLKLLKENLPTDKNIIVAGILKELIIHIFHGFFRFLYINNKKKSVKEKDKLIIEYYKFLRVFYALNDPIKSVRITIRNVNFSESKIGKSKELAYNIINFAFLFTYLTLFKKSYKYFSIGLKLLESYNDKYELANALFYLGMDYQWKGEFKEAIEKFKESIKIFINIGESTVLLMAYANLILTYIYISDYNKCLELYDVYLNLANKVKDNKSILSYYFYKCKSFLELGDYEKSYEFGLKGIDVSIDIGFIYCHTSIAIGELLFEKREIVKSKEYLLKAKELHEKNNYLFQYVVDLYIHIAEVYLFELINSNGKINELQVKKSCQLAIEKTKKWATHYGSALRVMAKFYAFTKKNKKAEKYFTESITHLQKIGRKYELAKSYYEYGIFLGNNGQKDKSIQNLEDSYNIFKEIDSKVYLKRTADLLGINDDAVSRKYTSTDRLLDRQKFSSVIKVSQDISSILNLEELLEHVMQKSIEVTGAKRGLLFIYNEETKGLEFMVGTDIVDNFQEI